MKLYTVDLRDIDLNSDWRRFMSKARMDKINKYKQEKSKLASIGAEIALIKAVRDNIPDAEIPVSWEYLQNGKPRLLKYPNFFYNISHSGDYAICAVSDSEVGVDIQKIDLFYLLILDHTVYLRLTAHIPESENLIRNVIVVVFSVRLF